MATNLRRCGKKAANDITTNSIDLFNWRFESLRGGFPSRWESGGFCPIDASIRGWHGLPSGSALVKCTSAIRQLAYATVPDSLDEYLQIGEKTSRDCLMHFCNGIIELYGEEYLRRPTQTDVEKLYAFHENKHGFPGMIRSIHCTKWSWDQCPQAYRAQFSRGDSGSEPFILLEAVASQDLWIWHAFFGVACSNKDINVLRQSPVLNDLKVGKAPEVPFVANDVTYKWGYYLTDGIYPEWAVLMKSISQPGSNDVKRIRY
ncbi:ALP1-like protein isoform X1 [Tanacetum coccineum]